MFLVVFQYLILNTKKNTKNLTGKKVCFFPPGMFNRISDTNLDDSKLLYIFVLSNYPPEIVNNWDIQTRKPVFYWLFCVYKHVFNSVLTRFKPCFSTFFDKKNMLQ